VPHPDDGPDDGGDGNGEDGADDACEDGAGSEREQDDERVQLQRLSHHERLQQVSLEFLHHDDERDDDERDDRSVRDEGDERRDVCRLSDGFYLAWPPRLVEEGLLGAVQPEDDEPALLGVGLQPVAGFALWRGRAEVDVRRTVGVLLHSP
jgi:hypothetical protein